MSRPLRAGRMSSFPFVLLLLASIPLMELWLLIELTKLTSLWWTIAVVVLTGMMGMSLVRWQGLRALRQIQQAVSSGQSPSRAIVSGVLVLVAGAFLLTPGILTDVAGFLLLIPPLRNAVAGWLQRSLWARVRTVAGGSVHVSSFSAGFPPTSPFDEPGADSRERPGVQVIEPEDRASGRSSTE